METRRKTWVLVGGLAILIAFGPGAVQWLQLRWRQHVMDRRLRVLEARRDELEAEQQRLKTDPVYVEDRIRSTFKVAKPGEFVVPMGDDAQSSKR